MRPQKLLVRDKRASRYGVLGLRGVPGSRTVKRCGFCNKYNSTQLLGSKKSEG